MKMKRFRKLTLAAGVWMLVVVGLSAQNISLDQAKNLYNAGEYAQAKPAFERLVKQSPNNASYNHWYGVCCYETGELEPAEKHLKMGVQRKVQESFRYLAEVYFKMYRFDESVELWEEYIDQLAKKKQETEEFQAKLGLAQRAARMVDRVENVQIIDSMVVNKRQFLDTYMLSEEAGRLQSYNDFFNTNSSIQATVYMNQKGDKIYYARPTNENQYCLFVQSKLLDTWGDEKQLPMNVNSAGNDNFPFVLTDGVTIYYASEGNGSIGGYDLFVTRYNMNNDTYLIPEQLGMPFNSLYNDYMMVIDEEKKLGWFASDRFQPEDSVCVYLFIPDDSHKRIDGDDLNYKMVRAQILSIQDSWVDDADYGALIDLAHQEILYGNAAPKRDFEFVVNDRLTYYNWEEIRTPEAKTCYEKALSIRVQIDSAREELETLRLGYTNGNASRKQQLRSMILQKEDRLFELLPQPEEWEKKARNAEIRYLNK